MTRGNQRDVDRARAQKRQDKNNKGKNDDFQKKKFTDAEIMRAKQKMAEEKKQEEDPNSQASTQISQTGASAG